MTQFVFASWNACVADQAKVCSSEVEGKSLQWFLYCSQVGGADGMEEMYGCHLPKSHPEPEEQAVTETSLCWAWNVLPHSPGQSSHSPLTTLQQIMRAMERFLSLGCFLTFRSTLALSSPMEMSRVAESHVQYAIYTAGLGHSASTLQGHSHTLGRICFRPLVHEVSGSQSPTWPGLCPAHCPALSWMLFLPPRCQPKSHPRSHCGVSTFPSGSVLSPCVQVCSGVVNPGEPRNRTLVLQHMVCCFHTAFTFACFWINHFKLMLAGFLISRKAVNAKQCHPYRDYF